MSSFLVVPFLLVIAIIPIATDSRTLPSSLQRFRLENKVMPPSAKSKEDASDSSHENILLRRWLEGRGVEARLQGSVTPRKLRKDSPTNKVETSMKESNKDSIVNRGKGVIFDLMDDRALLDTVATTSSKDSNWRRRMAEELLEDDSELVGVPGRRNQTTKALERELNGLLYETYAAFIEDATYAPSASPTLSPDAAQEEQPKDRRRVHAPSPQGIAKKKIPSNAFTVTNFDENDNGRQLVHRDTSRSKVYGVYVTKLEGVRLNVADIVHSTSEKVQKYKKKNDIRATIVHVENRDGSQKVDGIMLANTPNANKKQLLYPVDYRTYIKEEDFLRRTRQRQRQRRRRSLRAEQAYPFIANLRRQLGSKNQFEKHDVKNPEFRDKLIMQCPSQFRDNNEYLNIDCLREAYIYLDEELMALEDEADEDLVTYADMLYDLDTDRAESITRLSVQCGANTELVAGASRAANANFNASALSQGVSDEDLVEEDRRDRVLEETVNDDDSDDKHDSDDDNNDHDESSDTAFRPTHIFSCMSRNAARLNHVYAELYEQILTGHYRKLDAREKEGEWIFGNYEEEVSFCCGQDFFASLMYSLEYDAEAASNDDNGHENYRQRRSRHRRLGSLKRKDKSEATTSWDLP